MNKFTGKRALIVYFYPNNFTLGWVKEASDFQDKYEDFIAQNAKVFGISSNFEFSHKN
ncbi:redoxin domain-containing protein [Gillisia mitskevichiae]|uniref:redoxin domain-containing protein n=1 Tax=Gillisia mitskevichiae TaxID=270921 RepID=UPI003743BC7B